MDTSEIWECTKRVRKPILFNFITNKGTAKLQAMVNLCKKFKWIDKLAWKLQRGCECVDISTGRQTDRHRGVETVKPIYPFSSSSEGFIFLMRNDDSLDWQPGYNDKSGTRLHSRVVFIIKLVFISHHVLFLILIVISCHHTLWTFRRIYSNDKSLLLYFKLKYFTNFSELFAE